MIRNIRGATVEAGRLPKGTWWIEVHYNKDYGRESRLSVSALKFWVDVYWTRRKHHDKNMYWWTYGLTWQNAWESLEYKKSLSGCAHRASFDRLFFRR